MDIYRYFHPHHNPRLGNTPIRYTELNELQQAAAELRKAIERAQQRISRQPVPPILPEHCSDIVKAARFIESSLQTLCEVHSGDSNEELEDIAAERSSSAGWEAWTQNVQTIFKEK